MRLGLRVEMGFLGAVSGLLSAVTFEPLGDGLTGWVEMLAPGLWFGALLSALLVIRAKLGPPSGALLFSLIAGVWYLAVRATIGTEGIAENEWVEGVAMGLAGGAVGGVGIAGAATLLIPTTRRIRLAGAIAGAGTVGGLLVLTGSFSALLCGWQILVALAVGSVLVADAHLPVATTGSTRQLAPQLLDHLG